MSNSIESYVPREELRDTIIGWKNIVEQIVDAYRVRRGLVHGVQKDAIQNAWDARVYKKGKEWKITFELVEQGGRAYFVITDRGTYGLTGRILTKEEMESEEKLPENERWGRFEGLGFLKAPLGGTLGARGRGKFVFVGASKTNTIVYDSLRIDGSYRSGFRYVTRTRSPVWAGDEKKGKSKLIEVTGGVFKPLDVVGTRVIIVDPCEELITDVASGLFMRYIEETWWEIIQKYQAKIIMRARGRQRVAQMPAGFDLPEEDTKKYRVWIKNNKKVSIGKTTFKIRKLHIVNKRSGNVPDDIRGVAMQRGGMKICCIDPPRYIPWEIAKSIYGFITLDQQTEEGLLEAQAEDVEHYSYDFRKTLPNAIRRYIEDEMAKFAKEKLGWRVDARTIRRQMQREAERLALTMINKFAREIGISTGPGGGGGGGGKEWKKIRLQTMQPEFPRKDSLRVNYGESLKNISTCVINDTPDQIVVRFKLFIRRGDQEIKTFDEQDVTLDPSSRSQLFGPFQEDFSQDKYPETGKYIIVARIRSLMSENKGEELDEKRLSVYVEEDPPGRGLFEKCQAVEVEDLKLYPMMGQAILGESKGYIFEYNLAHPAYKAVGEDRSSLAEYLFRLMGYELCRIDLEQEEPRLFTKSYKEKAADALFKMNEIVGLLMFRYYSESA